MRTILIAPAVAALIVAAIAAPGGAKDRGRIPEATPAGKPESCVSTNRIRTTHVRSDQIIDFEMNGGQIYRNTLPYACPNLGFDETFGYETHTGQLCSVDTITVLQTASRTRGPTCGLGEFQPVTLAKK
jgi:hypothetical protein